MIIRIATHLRAVHEIAWEVIDDPPVRTHGCSFAVVFLSLQLLLEQYRLVDSLWALWGLASDMTEAVHVFTQFGDWCRTAM